MQNNGLENRNKVNKIRQTPGSGVMDIFLNKNSENLEVLLSVSDSGTQGTCLFDVVLSKAGPKWEKACFADFHVRYTGIFLIILEWD